MSQTIFWLVKNHRKIQEGLIDRKRIQKVVKIELIEPKQSIKELRALVVLYYLNDGKEANRERKAALKVSLMVFEPLSFRRILPAKSAVLRTLAALGFLMDIVSRFSAISCFRCVNHF